MLICETACSTVISQLTGVEKPLSSDIAEMRHVPAPTALTLPLASTIATLSSEEIHVAPWKYAFSGCTVYDNAAAAFSLPAPRSKVSLLSERAALSTPATTLMEAFTKVVFPSSERQEISASPTFLPETRPFLSIAAIFGALDSQITRSLISSPSAV